MTHHTPIAPPLFAAALMALIVTACGNHMKMDVEDVSYERGEEFVHLAVTLHCNSFGYTGNSTCKDPCAKAVFYQHLADDEQDSPPGPISSRTMDDPLWPEEEKVDSAKTCIEAEFDDGDRVTLELQSSKAIPEDEGVRLRVFPSGGSYPEYKEVEDFQ